MNNAASAYIVQNSNCITNGANWPTCNLTMNNIAGQRIVPAYSGTGSGVNTSTGLFTLSDGTTIGVKATGQTTYNLTITPGAAVRAKTSYMAAVANALPATTIAGSVLTTAETTPSIANMLASNKPAWGTLPDSGGSSATQSTNGGSLNTCGSSCGQINSGAINTNGQPINLGGSYLQWVAQPVGSWVSTLCNGWQQVGATIHSWWYMTGCLSGVSGFVSGVNACTLGAC